MTTETNALLPGSPLSASLLLLTAWIAIALAGLLRPSNLRFSGRALFLAGAAIGVLLAVVAGWSLTTPPEQLTLALGLPDLPFHVRLDALSSFFLFLLGAVSAAISIFAAGYFRPGEGALPGLMCLQYHLFLAGMGLVLIADDAYGFMVAWETMALASYFLVTTQHRIPEIRRAGFLYLLIAHLGAIAVLMSFGVMQGGSWQFTFDAMRSATLPPAWATVAFLLALVGFGAKAGLLPLHVWLPEAHPAAPSPVSALMSGVMLKIAVYGVLRVTFDLLGEPLWWWGLLPLGVGLLTAFYGIVFAAVQTDMKRLLAYSSIENLGVIFSGFGLALVFFGVGMHAVGALALVALLYHCLNHALMKSLLFLGTGAVLHATGERNLGRLGGLIHRMPWVAWLTLVGVLSIAGLPPLNGFVSEWLLVQAFLFTDEIPRLFVNMLIPLGAAVVVLCAALAGYVMVKFFGVVFLGQPREQKLAQARDCGRLEKTGLAALATGCVVLGLFPVQTIGYLNAIVGQLTGGTLPAQSVQTWWLLAPVPGREVSYGPLVFLIAILATVLLAFWIVRGIYHGRVRRSAPWDCGFVHLDSRMQDTAEGFGQPIRRIFQSFFHIERQTPTPFDAAPTYRIEVVDRWWSVLYEPLGTLVEKLATIAARLQQGRISTYLLYSFITLVVLLMLVL